MKRQKFDSLTGDDIAAIRDYYEKHGYTQDELAHLWGVSRTTVRRVLDDVEAKVSDNLWPPTDYEYEKNGHLDDEWPNVTRNFSPVVNIGGLVAGFVATHEITKKIAAMAAVAAAWGFVMWILWRAYSA
jgi:DNA-binding XRE family transcriptional regulator